MQIENGNIRQMIYKKKSIFRKIKKKYELRQNYMKVQKYENLTIKYNLQVLYLEIKWLFFVVHFNLESYRIL